MTDPPGQLLITNARQACVRTVNESGSREDGEPEGGGEEENQVKICEICQVEYEPHESVTFLPCSHFFHSRCITR